MRWFADLFWVHLGHWFGRRQLTVLAETCYRNGSAWFSLGKSLLDRDCPKEAVLAFEKATQYDPEHARAWCGLGAAHRYLANLPAARRAYDEAVRIDPRFSQALSNLGELCLIQGDPETALTYCDQSLACDPRLREALTNRVAALFELGRYPAAETAALEGIALFPQQAAMHVNYGNVLLHTGQARSAIAAFRKALDCDPGCAEAHLNLATLLGESYHLSHAIRFIEQEIALKGETAQRLWSLALAQVASQDHAAAEKTCHKALEMHPSNLSAMITLASCLSTRGKHHEAIDLHRQALQVNQNMPSIFSNIAFDATYLPTISAEVVFQYHREWSQRFEQPAAAQCYSHNPGGDPDRPLRIGYVSGDFGQHPVGFLLLDVLRHHDRSQYEIHCFSMMRKDDDITRAIREQAYAWHDILLTSHEDLAKEIHACKIDLLVDLSGHTAYNRLPTFVLKPAPLQVTWIGYFHSTGLDSIDYFITDPYTSPRGSQQWFSETPVWLPHSRFCYAPPTYATEVSPLPMNTRGYVTFGSFNRVEKLMDPVLDAWSRIVNAVPQSRLIVKAGKLEDDSIREELSERFAAFGLTGDRLELRGPSSHIDMLAQYGEIDIALDTFPFNGGMTTLEALWMGVPVTTLAGQGVVARQTVSALINIGLESLAFPNSEAFIEGTIALASDPQRLATIRGQLRSRMAASPLRQSESFTRDLETLYRSMWQAWCRGDRLLSALV